MKKFLLYGGVALGLLFTGCQSDNLQVSPEEPDVVGSDQTFYVNMSISGDIPGGSRSSSSNGAPDDNTADFTEGTGTENAINNAYFVFYDAEGNVIGNIVQIEVDNLEEDNTPVGATVEKSYKSTVAITLRKGDKKPTQVICFFNPIDPSNLARPLSQMQTVERTAFSTTDDGNQYFAMSNSVFYPATNDGTEPQIAVQIPDAALHVSEQAAKDALDDLTDPNVIKIYVERYATRLKFSAEAPSDYKTATRVYNVSNGVITTTVTPVTLSFEPQYWAVNAQANTNYVVKSFRQETAGTGEVAPHNYTYADLNKVINTPTPGVYTEDPLTVNAAWVWNNFEYNRSYWGMSPAYFQNTYPEVQSDLKDIVLKQTYLKYNELDTKGYAAADKKAHYFRETTVGSMALAAENPAAAVASVIYVGEYKLKLNGTELPEETSFYTYLRGAVADVPEQRPYVYFDANPGTATSVVTGGESMLKRFFAQSTILYRAVYDNEGEFTGEYTRLSIDNTEDLNLLVTGLDVAEISDEVKRAADGNAATMMKIRNNARTLQFKVKKVEREDGKEVLEPAASTGIYIVNNNAYKEIVADDATPTNTQIRVTDANVALMRQIGYSYYYTSGHGYFNIPVKHLGWYRTSNTQKNEGKVNWNLVRVGDFGMVRNHDYTINVTEILGLADGIGGDDVEIVPPANTEDYYMAYSVRILKWAVVPTQNVKL